MTGRRGYIYFEGEQPERAAWKALCAFADGWNRAHATRWANANGVLIASSERAGEVATASFALPEQRLGHMPEPDAASAQPSSA